MNWQAVPVSGTGHALVDLAGVARVKAHGEIAHKGLTNYVYDDDNSIKFPSGDISKSETVCAAKSSETKEDLATPKIVGSQKQDHWILERIAGKTTPKPAAPHLAENMFVEFLNKRTGIVYVKERSTFSRSLQEVPDSVNAVHSQVLRLGLP